MYKKRPVTNVFRWQCFFLFLAFFSINTFSFAQPAEREERNVTAFTKLYGYVRFFYPSDEAQRIDWDKFAVYGSERVRSAQNDEELVSVLKVLFNPIAPGVSINNNNHKTFRVADITPPDAENYKMVSWQHLGYGLSYFSPFYSSMRVNRPSDKIKEMYEKSYFTPFTQAVDISSYKGAEFYLSVHAKFVPEDSGAYHRKLHLVKDTSSADPLFSFISETEIQDSLFHTYTFPCKIENLTSKILIGYVSRDRLRVNIDSVHLFAVQNGERKEIPTPLPESYNALNRQEGVTRFGFFVTDDVPDVPLFPEITKVGEYVTKELVTGIFCSVPLGLYATPEFTYPKADTAAFQSLTNRLAAAVPDQITRDSLNVRLGAIVVAWNIFKHFFPYWKDASQSPGTILHNALHRAYLDTSSLQFLFTLKKFRAPLNDGHIFTVLYDGTDTLHDASTPLVLTSAEGNIAVRCVLDSSLYRKIHPGDVIDSIDHIDARQVFQTQEQYLSGSAQYKRVRALGDLLDGSANTSLCLSIRRDKKSQSVTVARSIKGGGYRFGSFSTHPPADGKIKKGIYYYNLSNDSVMDKIDRDLDSIQSAKALILDMRGYPKVHIMPLVNRLLSKKESDAWIKVHQIRYPDYANVKYQNKVEEVIPEEPHINTKTFVLADADAMSYSETFLGYMKDYRLATVVGQATAGTNSQLNQFYLPGGYSLSFSGELVTNHDGSRHHLKGIVPDVPVNPTLKGLREGRDEVLEKAIELAE